MLSYRREIALQGALQFSPKVEEWNCETIFYGHYRSTFNHCDIIGLKSVEFREKTKNKGCYGVQGHSRSSRSVPIEPVRDFLILINSNWHPISYRFGVIAAYCSNLGHCIFSPLGGGGGGLGTTYDVHLGLIGKRVVHFLLVLIELFSLGVTAESLQAIRDRKSSISLQRGQFDPKLLVQGVLPPIIFAQIVRLMNALQLCRWQFSHKETL